MDSIASAASESDPAESAAHERAELKGKRVVLGVSIWVVEKREGDLDRIEWVQGRWAVDKSHNHQHASPQASSTAATDATFDGMPSGDSGANLLTMSAVVPPKESSESTASTASTAAAGEGKGKVIFGLDRLDRECRPSTLHVQSSGLISSLLCVLQNLWSRKRTISSVGRWSSMAPPTRPPSERSRKSSELV